jgi:hypothetical protein
MVSTGIDQSLQETRELESALDRQTSRILRHRDHWQVHDELQNGSFRRKPLICEPLHKSFAERKGLVVTRREFPQIQTDFRVVTGSCGSGNRLHIGRSGGEKTLQLDRPVLHSRSSNHLGVLSCDSRAGRSRDGRMSRQEDSSGAATVARRGPGGGVAVAGGRIRHLDGLAGRHLSTSLSLLRGWLSERGKERHGSYGGAATVERLSDTDKRYKYMRTRRLVIIINLEQQLTRHGYDVKALCDQFDKPAEISLNVRRNQR